MELAIGKEIIIKTKWLRPIAAAGTVAMMFFCIFYMVADYDFLANWYFKMNDCFYRHDYWQQDFFTLTTKRQGNIFCAIGLLISGLFLYQLIKQRRKPATPIQLKFEKTSVLILLVCMTASTVAWIWGRSLVHQGFDEVFSAVNCASLPPFQTVSYYMLPNNHLLFNLLNGTLFHFADDKVFTGKFISLVSLWGITIVVFCWLSRLINNKFLAGLATIVITFQFPIWGFGFEARGYELYYLATWSSFFALMRYMESKDCKYLHYMVVAACLGYFCIPTFLCFHLAILLFGVFQMFRSKRFDIKFWQAQLVIILIVYLLYLPAISFSGIHALIGNQYVAAHIQNIKEFYEQGLIIFNDYLNYYSSNFIIDHNVADLILFLLPLILFGFYRNKRAISCGFLYLSLWLATFSIAWVMKIYPIDRAMGVQINISLALTVYALYLVFQALSNMIKQKALNYAVLAVFLIALGIHFGVRNRLRVSEWLYHNDINSKYDFFVNEGISIIPQGSSIAFSDECFYWYYLCKNRNDGVNRCPSGTEQYFVRLNTDPFPSHSFHADYVLFKTLHDYEIYKRK